LKIISVVGARPQFVKAASVLRAFEQGNHEYGENIMESVLLYGDGRAGKRIASLLGMIGA
jgi:UDP-N-acetylglucosamine 2-epimerase